MHGLSICHHVYPGNVTDSDELSAALPHLVPILDANGIARTSVTLVFDKGPVALNDTLALDGSGMGWIAAQPWDQTPSDWRALPLEQLRPLSSAQPGVQAAARRIVIHGRERLCVLTYSAPFFSEQLHSLSESLAKVRQALRRLSLELARSPARLLERRVCSKIERWLSAQFLDELVRYEHSEAGSRWRLQFHVDSGAFHCLITGRLGRTLLVTNRLDWTAQKVVAGCEGQQRVEQVFGGLKGGDWLGWGPMRHWTDSKTRIHAFYCMLGISLLNYLRRQAEDVCPQITMEQMLAELGQMEQYVLLYPPQGKKGVLIARSLSRRN